MNNAEQKRAQEKAAKKETRFIHHGKVLTIRQDILEYDGHTHQFEIIQHPGAVAILPLLDANTVILVSQWRRAAGDILLEIPAGTLEKEEDPFLCAQRELQEEIGYYARSLTPFGGFYTAPGFCTEYIHLFLGKDLEEKKLEAEDDEGIDVVSLSLDKALSLIESKKIIDAKTIAALYQYQYYKNKP